MSVTTVTTVQQSILGRIEKLLSECDGAVLGIGGEVANLAHAYNRLEDSKR